METFYSFVRRLVEDFNGVGLDYAFTGTLAVSYYSILRTTSNVDMMVTRA